MPTFGSGTFGGGSTFGSGHEQGEACPRLFRQVKIYLPNWFWERGGDVKAHLKAQAACMAEIEDYIRDLHENLFIETALGVWADQAGADRGQLRAEGETDQQFQIRIRYFEEKVTRDAILEAAQRIVDADVGGTVKIIDWEQIDPATSIPDDVHPILGQDFFWGQSRWASSQDPGDGAKAATFHLLLPAGISQGAFDAVMNEALRLKAAGFHAVVTEDVGL